MGSGPGHPKCWAVRGELSSSHPAGVKDPGNVLEPWVWGLQPPGACRGPAQPSPEMAPPPNPIPCPEDSRVVSPWDTLPHRGERPRHQALSLVSLSCCWCCWAFGGVQAFGKVGSPGQDTPSSSFCSPQVSSGRWRDGTPAFQPGLLPKHHPVLPAVCVL